MTDKIPDDVMEAAREALCTALTVSRSRSADDGFETIARALLTERESATKAERERHEKLTSELAIWVYGAVTCKDWHWDGDQKFAAMECLVSAYDSGYLLKYNMGEIMAIVCTSSKGDG